MLECVKLVLQSIGGKRPSHASGMGGSGKSDEVDHEKPMSREEMEQLAEGLGRLDEKVLGGRTCFCVHFVFICRMKTNLVIFTFSDGYCD